VGETLALFATGNAGNGPGGGGTRGAGGAGLGKSLPSMPPMELSVSSHLSFQHSRLARAPL
jgi:hypothetical protein